MVWTLPLLWVLSTTTTATATAALPAQAKDSRWPALEARYSHDQHEEGRREAKALLVQHADDVELHVLYARFLYEVGERHQRDDAFDKLGLYTEMVTVLTRARQLAPGDARVGWGLGIAKARLGTTQGVLSSLSMAKEIEDLWLQAATSDVHYVSLSGEENLPCDAYLTLGIFYRLIPDWWIVEAVAGTRGNVDKALMWLQKARACAPDAVRMHKELGVGLLCAAERKGDPSLVTTARGHFTRGLAMTARFHTEQLDHRDMKRLMTQTSDACGYSRDGQQSLDASTMTAAH
jgi:hypothetical protein